MFGKLIKFGPLRFFPTRPFPHFTLHFSGDLKAMEFAINMTKFFLICLGSAFGGGARYLLSGWVLSLFGVAFPYSTIAVNVVGSFLIGIVMHLGLTTEIFSPTVRIVLATGVLGGFTTYSSFNYETLQYFQDGEIGRAVINVFIMVFGCLVAGLLGLGLAKRLIGG